MKREKNHWAGCPGGIRCRSCKSNDTKRDKQGYNRAVRRKKHVELRRETA